MESTSLKNRITNYELRITGWIKKNRLEATILAIILLVGAFFRLYRIDEYMTFLGDEGRDVIVVRRLLVDFDPILIGPGTSIGNMYLGPVYYYMMAPALLLANFSPVGPAVMIALLGVATIFFVWWVGREWFPSTRLARSGLVSPEDGNVGQASIAGLVAAGLYAVSPTVIIYSRSSWNPNIMPFFALLTIYSVWQFWQKDKWSWLIITAVSFAFVLQSHYLGLLLGPVIAFFWLLTFLKSKEDAGDKGQGTRKYLSYTLYAAILFLILMSPLIIFDARHNWINFRAMHKFFTQRQTTVSARPWTAIPKFEKITNRISTRLIAGKYELLGKWVTAGFVLGIFWLLVKYWKKLEQNEKKAYFLIGAWLFFALLGLGVYKQEIYDHYYGFFFAAPFLLIGGISQKLVKTRKFLGKIIVFFIVLLLMISNLRENPLKYPPNRQLQRTQDVVRKVSELSEGRPFNIGVIAERNYEGAYMYFFEMWDIAAKIAIADILDETLTDQLFVVCEVKGEKCNPETNERPELANFGWRKVVAAWEVADVTIHKVIHEK